MSTDSTLFRSKVEPAAEAPPMEGKESPRSATITSVEVPYLDYENTHNHPYSVDYFNLGNTWNDPVGGFPKEVGVIESYIQDKINAGEIANSISAIKEFIRGMEKVNNLTKEERSLIKVETLSAYIEFLRKTDHLKHNLRRYGNRTY